MNSLVYKLGFSRYFLKEGRRNGVTGSTLRVSRLWLHFASLPLRRPSQPCGWNGGSWLSKFSLPHWEAQGPSPRDLVLHSFVQQIQVRSWASGGVMSVGPAEEAGEACCHVWSLLRTCHETLSLSQGAALPRCRGRDHPPRAPLPTGLFPDSSFYAQTLESPGPTPHFTTWDMQAWRVHKHRRVLWLLLQLLGDVRSSHLNPKRVQLVKPRPGKMKQLAQGQTPAFLGGVVSGKPFPSLTGFPQL